MSGFCPHHSTILLHGWLNKENEWCSYILSPHRSTILLHGWLNKENEWCRYILSPHHSATELTAQKLNTVDWTKKISYLPSVPSSLYHNQQNLLLSLYHNQQASELNEQRKWSSYLLDLIHQTCTIQVLQFNTEKLFWSNLPNSRHPGDTLEQGSWSNLPNSRHPGDTLEQGETVFSGQIHQIYLKQ